MLRKLAILLPVAFPVLFLCCACVLLAQAQQGTLSGTLSGLNGKTGAVLILTNTATSTSQRITPSADGTFSVNLPPGTYRVEVERNGFRQTATQNISIVAQTTSTVNVTLQGGPNIEAVEVKANAPGAQTSGSEVGEGFTTSTVRELPVFDRNYQELNGLMSGVTPPESGFPLTFDPQINRQFDTNGLAPYTNDSLTDGTTIREPYTNELATRILPDEAIQQLNVVTGNYPAREGFAAGTISDVFPRPGTNSIHGSLFGFMTDDYFRTNDPFTTTGFPQPTVHDRQYGGTVGGALSPDRLFFFLSYQGNINDGSNTEFATVPTSAELLGDFSGAGTTIYNPLTGLTTGAGRIPFAGGIIPAADINPASALYLSLLPAANLPFAANNLEQNVQYRDRGNVADGRLDYHFSNNVTGFLNYGWSSFNAAQNSIFGPIVGGPTLATLRNQHASGSIVGNEHGIITELRVGYSRYRNLISPNGPVTGLPLTFAALGVGGATGAGNIIPSVTIDGLGALGTPINTPVKDVDDDFDGTLNFHAYHGRNEIVFGVDVRDDTSFGFNNFAFGSAGSFLFGPGATSLLNGAISPASTLAQSLAAFELGTASESGVFSTSVAPRYNQARYGGFVGDLVRLRHLTVDLGFRYEVYSPVAVSAASILNLSSNTLSPSSTVGSYYYKNLDPRIGLAFRITDNTVVRASYSIISFPMPFNLLPINVAGSGGSLGIPGTLGYTPFSLPFSQASVSIPLSIPYYVNNLTRNPYVQSYYFMVEHSAPWGFLMNAGYMGNVTREMPFISNLNAALPGTGTAGLPYLSTGQTTPIYLEGNGLTSNYNSLQVNLSKRLSKGAAFAVAYTYSHALDYGADGVYLMNPFNTAANYGSADWDRQQLVTISHIFNLSWGHPSDQWRQSILGKILGDWRLNGIFHYATGTPYNMYADAFGCDCPGVSAALPAGLIAPNFNGFAAPTPGVPVILASTLGAGGVNGLASFNPALFTAPAASALGNLGRNAIRGPNMTDYNLALLKQFPVRENTTVEIRAEAYNLLNSTLYGTPYSNVSLGNFGTSTPNTPLDGMLGGGGRTFVLGARILF